MTIFITLQDDCFRDKMRRNQHKSLGEMEKDLDSFLAFSNKAKEEPDKKAA